MKKTFLRATGQLAYVFAAIATSAVAHDCYGVPQPQRM
jgi:hypothetical protein